MLYDLRSGFHQVLSKLSHSVSGELPGGADELYLWVGFGIAALRVGLHVWLVSRAPAEYNSEAGWSSQVARWAHNPKVAGSNPAPATNEIIKLRVIGKNL